MLKTLPFYLICFVVMGSCAPSRFVKPLQKDQQAVSVALGGSLFEYGGLVIPMPFLSAAYGYGIDSTLTGFAALNVTSAVYGNLQLELGATKQVLKQSGYAPALSVTPVANIIYRNKDAKKFYPQLDINAFWEFNGQRNLLYAGVSNWFELGGKKAHEQKQTDHWLISPQIGQTFIRQKWDFTIEAKIMAPGIAYESNVVEYKSPLGKRGAFGIYFGYTRKF
jgi:hypothetical protein